MGLFGCVLCAFADFFNGTGEKKAVKELGKKIEKAHAALVCRESEVDETGRHLSFQIKERVHRQSALDLAKKVQQTLDAEGAFEPPLECIVVFQEFDREAFSQIRVQKEACEISMLP